MAMTPRSLTPTTILASSPLTTYENSEKPRMAVSVCLLEIVQANGIGRIASAESGTIPGLLKPLDGKRTTILKEPER